MKKLMMKSAILAMAMTVAAAFTACSDDKDEATLVVNNNETTVSINRLGGSIEIPINASGDWTAEVTKVKEGLDWAAANVENGKLSVEVDYFNPNDQKQERTTDLVVKCGDKTQTVRIRQYIGLKDGETVANSESQPYYDLWFNKGIGSGVDPLTGEQKSSVLNLKGIKKAQADGREPFSTLFRQTTFMNATNDVKMIDTLENNTVKLAAGASIEVSFLKFKLKVNVKYSNEDLQLNDVKTYNAEQKVVFLESATDVMTVRSLLLADPKITKGETKNMVSIGFQNLYRDITNASEKNDEEELKYCIEDLIDGYGPVFITGAELGGSLFTSMRYDSLMMANNFDVKGDLAVKLALSAITIEGSAEVDYGRHGKDIWVNSQHYSTCSGGDQEAITKLTGLIGSREPDPKAVEEVGKAWAKSIISSNDEKDNTTLVKITYTPIWNLFPRKIANKIKTYVVDHYKGKKIGIADPALLEVLGD